MKTHRVRRLALALASVSLIGVTSCSRMMHGGSSDPSAQVIFVNQSLEQADVYVIGSAGQTQRIGTVFAGRTETLNVPSSFIAGAGSVNIVARLLASSLSPRTGPLTLSPGQAVQVTLPTNAQTLTVLPSS